MAQPDLTGRVALVTGSARGLGRALCLDLADHGADVAVHYNRSADAAKAVERAATERGVETTTVSADVTDAEDIEALFDTIEADLGRVDILVNNVGAFDPRHWRELSPADWRRVLETNLMGTYLTCRRGLPMPPDGRIVNIGYASGEKGLVSPKNFPYFVAKTGVLMFTRMLAADTQDASVTVNAVSPYVMENSDRWPEELPRGRAADYEDVARAVRFFVDPANEYVSGANIEVDGGWLPESV
jgi:3-oxoacyl-[acyl-carrier protein] reductase